MNRYAQAYKDHVTEARAALALYRDHCGGTLPPRVPGMDTIIRLAFRISQGWTIEDAAAREYLYRWHLAIKPFDQCDSDTVVDPCVSIFGAPHTIGA